MKFLSHKALIEFFALTAFVFATVALLGYVIAPALGIAYRHGEYGYLAGSALGVVFYYVLKSVVRRFTPAN